MSKLHQKGLAIILVLTLLCLLNTGIFGHGFLPITIEKIRMSSASSDYTTYLGGSMGEDATKVAFDNEGNSLLIGQTPSEDFPITGNAFQSEYGGGNWDGFIAKFSPSGELLFSSYLGGSGYEHVTTVIADSENNIVLAGTTGSANFPITPDALDSSFGGLTDGFIMKIAPNGTLLYSTFFGGSGNDWIYGMAFDVSGNYMFSGYTDSSGLGTSGVYQQNQVGGSDAFVARISADGSTKQMFSYVGGSNTDRGYMMKIDSSHNYVFTGITISQDYPTTLDAFQSQVTSGGDAILTKISYDGSTLMYSTLLGGNDDDLGLSIAVDSNDNMIITGYTESDNLSVYNALQPTYAGDPADIYIAKFNETGSLLFLTYLGGDGTDYAWEVATDPDDNIVIAGRSSSSDYPAHDGLNDTLSGSFDAVATKITPDGQTIIVSSYIGGSMFDIGEGLAIDSEGNVVVSGRTASLDFPVTSGAYQEENAGTYDVFICHTAFNPPATTTTSSSTTTTTTSSSTTNSTDASSDNTMMLMIGGAAALIIIIAVIVVKKR